MFTLEQIEQAHKKVKSGADFPRYIQKIKEIGVKGFETWVTDSSTEYFGKNQFSIKSKSTYNELIISNISNKEDFIAQLKIHQQGESDYFTFCKKCAENGIEKWVVNLEEMTCIYFDKIGTEILVEKIPEKLKIIKMEKLKFKISINASANKVYDFMLGISSLSTYEQWTALFNPTSTYEGNWDKGSKILFIGIDEKGEKGGMVSRIIENIPHQFVSIQHYGLFKADKEITEGAEVEKWANGFENYTFEETNGITTVFVDLDTTEDFIGYMNASYPKALEKLKELCEK